MNLMLKVLFLIQGINGYCESFCINTSCVELNGNISSECGDCGIEAMCNFETNYNTNMTSIAY